MAERYANKRMLFRSRGRFAGPPSLAQMGFDVADGPMTCVCGFTFQPILKSGKCPECGATEKLPQQDPPT
jgi:hypothetical protein